MSNFSQGELNSIREVVMCHQTMSAKLQTFANDCQDRKVKQMFSQASLQAQQSAQKLIEML